MLVLAAPQSEAESACSECLARLRDGAALEALCPAADAAPLAGAACACRDWQEIAAPRISEPPTASSVAREEGEVHDAADVVRGTRLLTLKRFLLA